MAPTMLFAQVREPLFLDASLSLFSRHLSSIWLLSIWIPFFLIFLMHKSLERGSALCPASEAGGDWKCILPSLSSPDLSTGLQAWLTGSFHQGFGIWISHFTSPDHLTFCLSTIANSFHLLVSTLVLETITSYLDYYWNLLIISLP